MRVMPAADAHMVPEGSADLGHRPAWGSLNGRRRIPRGRSPPCTGCDPRQLRTQPAWCISPPSQAIFLAACRRHPDRESPP